MPVAIHLQSISKSFESTRAVDNVSLEINPGDLFFLLGPSGCGKTTLLRSIAGFVTPDSGRILLDEQDITTLPPHRRDTGMVFQSYALWPHLTVAQNVAFGLEMRGLRRAELQQRVSEALATVQMLDRADHRPNQLSGGQQQRVALARALVVRPRCLLLDEPLSNLDAKLRLDMRGEIRRICKEAGLTSIYVTHDQKEALSIADQIAIMRDGRIVQTGSPMQIYRHPNSEFVAEFIGEANFIDGQIHSAPDTDTLRIKTALGELIARQSPNDSQDSTQPNASFSNGTPVRLCIRPEALRLDDAPDHIPNRIRGRLRDSVYLGEVAQHRLDAITRDAATPALPLKIFELNPRHFSRDESAQVQAWVDPRDIVILPKA